MCLSAWESASKCRCVCLSECVCMCVGVHACVCKWVIELVWVWGGNKISSKPLHRHLIAKTKKRWKRLFSTKFSQNFLIWNTPTTKKVWDLEQFFIVSSSDSIFQSCSNNFNTLCFWVINIFGQVWIYRVSFCGSKSANFSTSLQFHSPIWYDTLNCVTLRTFRGFGP